MIEQPVQPEEANEVHHFDSITTNGSTSRTTSTKARSQFGGGGLTLLLMIFLVFDGQQIDPWPRLAFNTITPIGTNDDVAI